MWNLLNLLFIPVPRFLDGLGTVGFVSESNPLACLLVLTIGPALVLGLVFWHRWHQLGSCAVEARLDASCAEDELNAAVTEESNLPVLPVMIASIEHVVPSMSIRVEMGGLGKMHGIYSKHSPSPTVRCPRVRDK